MKDLFGAEAEEQRKPMAHGYAATPGTGPAGETCKTCAHICRKTMSKTYLKCGLMRAHWTGGPGSDIRAKSPACARWEKAILETVAEKFGHLLRPKPPNRNEVKECPENAHAVASEILDTSIPIAPSMPPGSNAPEWSDPIPGAGPYEIPFGLLRN